MPEQIIHGRQRGATGQDLNLLAGQLYFGHNVASVRTLLGSCVAVTLWHPGKRLGGMCHFLLPQRPGQGEGPADGRFGTDAIAWLVQAVARAGTRPSEYRAGLYGGADTMPDQAGVKLNVGERNIELGWSLIESHGFELFEVDVGDCVPRHVRLVPATGEVSMRRGPVHQPSGAVPARMA